jgi:two-component system, chemotaxis family, chemotaxis protein CheY
MIGEPQLRLLVVEDDEAFRLALEAEAKASGRFASVITASDGQQALDGIKAALQAGDPSALPEVVLTDLYMPNLNGVELISFLRRNPQTARIIPIMFSGCDSPAEKTAAKEAGSRAFFRKPATAVGIQGLLQAVAWIAASHASAA